MVQQQDSAGTMRWSAQGSLRNITDLLTDRTGDFYCLTSGNGNVDLGIAVTCLTSQGILRWTSPSGNQTEYGATGAVGTGGHISLAGLYQVGAGFGPFYLSSYSVNGVGAESFYLAQLGVALPTAALPGVAPQPLRLYPLSAHDLVTLPSLPIGTQIIMMDALGRNVYLGAALPTLNRLVARVCWL